MNKRVLKSNNNILGRPRKKPLHKIKPKKTRVFEFSSPLKNYRKTILHDSNFIHPYPAPFNSINSNFQSPKTFTARFHPRFKPQTSHFFFFFPSHEREHNWRKPMAGLLTIGH